MKLRTERLERPPEVLAHHPPLAWLSTDQTLVGHGEALRFSAGVGDRRFAAARSAFEEFAATAEVVDEVGVPGSGLTAFASFTFDGRSHGSVLIVPEIVVGRHCEDWFVTAAGDVDPRSILDAAPPTPDVQRDRPRFAGASIPDLLWLEAVATVIDRIREGRADKVVLARDFALWSRTPFSISRLLERLAGRFPGCFTFAVDGLVGASPELLLRTDGTRVESVALAGTIGRSSDPEEDARLGSALMSSEKDLAEHRSAAASVAAVLDALCADLRFDSEPGLRRLDNLQHLSTSFHGTLAAPSPALEIVDALHPTAAVGGSPTDVAIDMIRELEGMDRGRYAGPVGWLDAAGNAEFAIALRCAEISGARARLFAGAGIMADSLPERELEETRLKLGAMVTALE